MSYQEAKQNLFTFLFTVNKLVDADTFEGDIDRGFRDKSEDRRIRLARVNAWETKGAEKEIGLKALAYVGGLIKLGDKVIIKTLGKDNFGRIVSELYLPEGNLSDLLVQNGHAIYKDYGRLNKF